MPHDTPHPVDLHVGGRLRLARRLRALPQQVLAQRLGVSFQQIQKYEKGTNRISASTLYGLAVLLNVPIAWFFAGLESASPQGSHANIAIVRAFMATREGAELALLLPEQPPRIRAQVLALIHAFADPEPLADAC